MIFLHINYWWWILPVIIIAGYGAYIFLRQRKMEIRIPFFLNNRNYNHSFIISIIKTATLFLSIVFLGFALLAPAWGLSKKTVEKKGLDLVFAIDVSKSMNALDFSNKNEYVSRLDAEKYLIENFVKTRVDDRFGLIVFAGESFVASPLTFDQEVFLNFVRAANADDIGRQGTNLADALEVALSRLEIQSTEERGKAIILISDGDETINSKVENMAKMAKEKNISIFTIGLGSKKGVPIPEGQDAFGNIYYKKYKGETVLTKLNEETLKKITETSDGAYFHAEAQEDIFQVSEKLKDLPQTILEKQEKEIQEERYYIFAFLGFLFLGLSVICPENIALSFSNFLKV